jgi:hypothetical protein
MNLGVSRSIVPLAVGVEGLKKVGRKAKEFVKKNEWNFCS